MRNASITLAMLALASVFWVAPLVMPPDAVAAQQQKTQKKAQQKQPVDIEADNMEVLEDKDMVIFTGNVRVVKGDTKLFAKRLEVFLEKEQGQQKDGNQGGGQKVREAIATGGVRIVKPDMTITGQRARMDVKRDLVWVTGDVVVKRRTSTIRGQKLFANLRTNVTRIEAGKRRVRATFTSK